MKKIYILGLLVVTSISSQAQIVISQVYGGGGNGGATYTNDFVELFNRGTVAQSLNGWSIQYNSSAGTTWNIKTDLPNVMIQPGKYFLIQEASNAAVGASLPTPDLDGVSAASTSTTGIAMSASGGKLVLANSTTFVTGANPVDAQIVDKVGYGTAATGFEGTGPTGVAISATLAAFRLNSGCTDTDNNPTDFSTAIPAPRNSSTAANTCSLQVNQNSIAGLEIYPNPVTGNILNITTDANATKNVVIVDVLGKQVLNVTTDNATVNVGNLNAGVYIVKITEEGKTATRKLVIR